MRLPGFAGCCDHLLAAAAPACHYCSAAPAQVRPVPAGACPEERVATLFRVLPTCSVWISMCSGNATVVIGMAVGARS
jgi:hypothetical protein